MSHLGWLNFLINRQAAIITGALDAIDANDLKREVVLAAALFRQRDQLAAGILGGLFADDLVDFVFGEIAPEAVGRLHDEIAGRNADAVIIRADHRLLADRAREDRAKLAVHRIGNGDQPELELHAGIGVIAGNAPN